MAFSYIEYTADGSTTTFSIPFDYTAEADIKVFVDGVEDTSFTFNSTSVVQTSTTPAAGVVVRVERNTDLTSRAVDFASGSVLTEEDLDNSNIQVFFAAQEAIDTAESAIFQTPDGKWDGQSRVIKNVADPTNAQDVVTKNWAETALSSQLQQATTQATNASNSATNASNSASSAATSASTATTKASEASTSASQALASKNDAETAETNAESSATEAATSESNAATSETNAASSASSAASSASTASSQASVATSAASTATAQATSATNSANAASSSETNAATSESNASTSASSASTSASAAQAARDAAEGYRDSASTSASNALTSANNASTSETNAATSETNASNSASAAATSETNAAASAASAAAVLDNFDDRYLGAKASDPAVDNDGDALITGALYFNTTDGVMKIYSASGWIAASSASVATMEKYKYTATSGQTVFSGADDDSRTLSMTVGAEIVTLNGIVLESGTDYSVTSSAITLSSGSATGDELNIYAFGNFQVADTVSKADGGTFDSTVTFADGITVDNDGATVATFDRATDDGTIAEFQKDGTTVGSVNAQSGDLLIGTNNTGLIFYDDEQLIFPRNTNGSTEDGTVSLGATVNRFKDLFLSGGVVFGDAGGSGTSSSNTFDSYEEGTWTPTLDVNGFNNARTLSSASGDYTKVGRLVTVRCALNMSGTCRPTSFLEVGGLPFSASARFAGAFGAAHAGTGIQGGSVMIYDNTDIIWYPSNGTTESSNWYCTITYQV